MLQRTKLHLEETNTKLSGDSQQINWKERTYEDKIKSLKDQMALQTQSLKQLEGRKFSIFFYFFSHIFINN